MKDNNENKLSEQDMKENQGTDQEKRRKAVKNILMAGGSAITAGQLASSDWTKPVIESVVLPAHAATSVVGFSITDPVALTYDCSGDDVVVDIMGYIDQPIAGIRVRLELTWTNEYSPGNFFDPLTVAPPIIIQVNTAADGSYSSSGHNIGYNVAEVSVTASLPDFPDAVPDTDTIAFVVPGDYSRVRSEWKLPELRRNRTA